MGIKAVKLYFKGVILVASAAVLVLSITLNGAGKTAPADSLWLQYLSVFAPFLIILNTILLFYWISNKSIVLLIPLAALAVNFKYINTLVGVKFGRNAENPDNITVCTYNINYFSHSQYSNVKQVANSMRDYSIDVLAMQEFKPTGFYNYEEIAGEFDLMEFNSIYDEDEDAIGMAIFSRYPIIKSSKIKFENTGNGAMWADLLIGKDTVRVINNHLQTTGYYTSYPRGFKYLLDKMGENFIIRSAQAKIIRKLIDTTRYAVIVLGDFNDTPNGFVYNTIKGNDLKDSFREQGRGFGGTFRRTMGLLRIDMILHSRHFEAKEHITGSEKLSDHKPVIAVLEYKN